MTLRIGAQNNTMDIERVRIAETWIYQDVCWLGFQFGSGLFSCVDLEARVGVMIRCGRRSGRSKSALADLSEQIAWLYPPRLGRPSIPPERLLRTMLLQAFYAFARRDC